MKRTRTRKWIVDQIMGNTQMAHLRMHQAVGYLTADQGTSANTGPDCHIYGVRETPGCSPARFA